MNNNNIQKKTSSHLERIKNRGEKVDKNPVREIKSRQREEGFSVYLMGANEERIKNLRKKEQIDQLMSRNRSNSKNINEKFKKDKNNKRNSDNSGSKPKNREIVSAIPSNLRLKEIHHNHKILNSKESLMNLEDMLSNIDQMKQNLTTNLNKLNFDDGSPVTRRRRNFIDKNKVNLFEFSSNGRDKSPSPYLETNNIINENQDLNELVSETPNYNIKPLTNINSQTLDFQEKNRNINKSHNKSSVNVKNLINTSIQDNQVTNEEYKCFTNKNINSKRFDDERPLSSVFVSNNKDKEAIKYLENKNQSKFNRPYSQLHLKNIDVMSNRVNDNFTIEKIEKIDIYSHSNFKNNFNSHLKNNENVFPEIKFNKKNEIISKINQFDEKKITKLAKLLEKFDHLDLGESHESTEFNDVKFNKKKLLPVNKFNINYIQAENLNVGSLNLNNKNNNESNSSKENFNTFERNSSKKIEKSDENSRRSSKQNNNLIQLTKHNSDVNKKSTISNKSN